MSLYFPKPYNSFGGNFIELNWTGSNYAATKYDVKK